MTTSLHTVSITTDASGDFTAKTPNVQGPVRQVRYVPDGSNPLATGADLDIVSEQTGLVVANHDNIGTSAFTRAYRQPTHDADGSASLYAGSGEPVEDLIYLGGERLTVTISNGGNTLSGTIYIWIG